MPGTGALAVRRATVVGAAIKVVERLGSLVARGLVEDDLESAQGREGWCSQRKEGFEGSRVGIMDDKSVGRV